MKYIKKVDTIIFDMDGTLLKSDTYCVDAIQKAICDVFAKHKIKAKIPSPETILREVGKPSRQFYKDILPVGYKYLIGEVFTEIQKNESEALRNGKGKLFDGTLQTLKYLKEKNYNLALVSNCSSFYFHTVIEVFNLDKYLSQATCIGDVDGFTKSKIIVKFIEEFGSSSSAVIGDRFYDIEAGKQNGCITIGCLYGYGKKSELENADFLIGNISQLKEIF
ncbi:MAG: HAD family hydrolase [Candidatus Cloacimonetes bacterium]|nr:HAD family hydrolase [Candidatus Cloacimonadota bacterium]